MTIVASGSIAMSALNAEFYQGSSISMSSLYRLSRPYVPNITTNTSICVTGPISFSQFYSTQGYTFAATTTSIATKSI